MATPSFSTYDFDRNHRSLFVAKANGTDVARLHAASMRAGNRSCHRRSSSNAPMVSAPIVDVGNIVEENLVVHDFQLPYERDVGKHFVGAV